MIIGMMTRTALGHTGRPLRASLLMVFAYVFVILATISRLAALLLPLVITGFSVTGITVFWHISACLWLIAFLAYAYQYAPYLTSPRADGRQG